LLHELTYSTDDVEYTAIKQKVFDASNKEFEEYFLKNCESCKCMWVSYKRDEYMHLGNATNNRLESHNQKLKDLTLRSSSLCEMFQNIFNFMQISASEYSQATFIEEFTTVSTLGEEFVIVGQIRNSCTHYAAEMLIEQLQLSKTVSYTVQASSEGTYAVSSSQNSYNVGKEN